MKKIILDTNFLLLPATMKVDIFTEIDNVMDEPYELFIIKEIIDELNNIINTQGGKDRDAAKLALQLIKKKKIKTNKIKQKSLYMNINSKDTVVDDILLNISDMDTIIATQDGELRKKLSAKGIKTIILRGKKQVEIR
jgi:rRNA-processing protein FCF1